MHLHRVSTSIIRLIESGFIERFGDRQEHTFSLLSSTAFAQGGDRLVSLFLYRIDIDQARRHVARPPVSNGRPRRLALALELRYLLTVWSSDPERAQQILGVCMEILDERATLSGSALDPRGEWEEGDALQVCLESMSNEDMLRLWDSFEPPYHLSVPYLVRTVRLGDVERGEGRLVESRRLDFHGRSGGPGA